MISPAEQILARLEAADLAYPRLDRQRVEVAWREHCRRLRLEALPLRWMRDAEEALAALDAETATFASWWSAWKSAVAEVAAEVAGEDIGHVWAETNELPEWSATRSRVLLAAWRAAQEAAGLWSRAGEEAAGWSAPEAAGHFVLSSDPPYRELAERRWLAIWRPFVDAFEAGHWLFAVCDGEVLAVPRPALRVAAERLHSETGPAVFWPDGARYFFRRGVRVPAEVIEDPASLTAERILREPDAAVQREMIDRVGADRLMHTWGKPSGPRSRHGRLWRLELDDCEPLVVVEVVDPSTARRHFLRVPPTTETPREGLAWSFELPAVDYRPALES